MKVAQLRVPPLADHISVTHHDGANEGVGADAPPTPLRELESLREVTPIRGCEQGVHRLTD